MTIFNLSGMNALITGATGGIGGAIATTLQAAGARVLLSATNRDRLADFAKTIGSLGDDIFPCNLANESEVERLIDDAEAHASKIDILVCNAGITKDNLSLRMKNEEFDEVININLRSSFILNRAAAKKMMKRRFGRIINISSVVALAGNPGQANYVAAKAGLIGMGKVFALEFATRGITVNSIAPGFIASKMTDVMNDEQKAKINMQIPMGKMGDCADVAAAVAFLASRDAGYITGQTIHINGGMILP